MDITEVPVSEGSKGKGKKNKKAKTNVVKEEGDEGSSGVEKKTESAMATFPPAFSITEIKNKQRRHVMFMKLKQEKRQVNRPYSVLSWEKLSFNTVS